MNTEDAKTAYQNFEDGLDFKRRYFERGTEFDEWLEAEKNKAAALALLAAAVDFTPDEDPEYCTTIYDPWDVAEKLEEMAQEYVDPES